MKMLEYLVKSLELDVYPHRIPLISVGVVLVVGLVVFFTVVI